MKSFLVIVCAKCGGLLLATTEQKTRTCPYCDSTVFVYKAKKVASCQNAREASTILQKLKTDAALKQKNSSRQ